MLDLTFAIRGIFFNYHCPVAQSLEFRRAIAAVMDRSLLPIDKSSRVPIESMIPTSVPTQGKSNRTLPSHQEAIQYFLQHFPKAKPLVIPFRPAYSRGIKGAAWCSEVIKQLNDAGLPEPTDSPFSHRNTVEPFELVGIILDDPDPLLPFRVFQEGGPWVPKLQVPDVTYQNLVREATQAAEESRRNELLHQLEARFSEQQYAVPLFKEKVSYLIDPNQVVSLNEFWQRPTLMFHRLKVREGAT